MTEVRGVYRGYERKERKTCRSGRKFVRRAMPSKTVHENIHVFPGICRRNLGFLTLDGIGNESPKREKWTPLDTARCALVPLRRNTKGNKHQQTYWQERKRRRNLHMSDEVYRFISLVLAFAAIFS